MQVSNLDVLRMMKRLASSHNSRAKRLGIDGVLTAEFLVTLYEQTEGVCPVCKRDKSLDLDHILALSKGGLNTHGNVQFLCEICHVDKESGGKISNRFNMRFNKDDKRILLTIFKRTGESLSDIVRRLLREEEERQK